MAFTWCGSFAERVRSRGICRDPNEILSSESDVVPHSEHGSFTALATKSPRADDPESSSGEPLHGDKSQPWFALTAITLLCSIFAGLVLWLLGWCLVHLWIATSWSMALLLWACYYWLPDTLDQLAMYFSTLLEKRPCQNQAYADAHLMFDVIEMTKWHQFLFLNVLTLGTIGLCGGVLLSATKWQRHLSLLQDDAANVQNMTTHQLFHFHEASNMTDMGAERNITYVLTHSEYACQSTGILPMPYVYLLAKLTLGSFIQDVVAGSKDLSTTFDQPIGWVASAFVIYQSSTLLAIYAQSLLHVMDGRIAGDVWTIYQLISYRVLAGNPFTNAMLLMCKMLVETNINPESKSPHSFDRLERYELPRGRYSKANVFWMVSLLVGLVGLPVLCTHSIPAVLGSCCALSFPIWGVACLVISLFYPSMRSVVFVWAQAHAQVWGLSLLLILLVVASMLLREQLWRIQCMIVGGGVAENRVNGKYGYAKGTMTLFFATPLVFCMQSLPIWADLAYGGWSLGTIPFTEFNLRVLHDYNECFIGGSLVQRFLKWFAVL